MKVFRGHFSRWRVSTKIARNPDGSPNPVLQPGLRGETFRGRAYVANDWHDIAYEAVWNADHTAKARAIAHHGRPSADAGAADIPVASRS